KPGGSMDVRKRVLAAGLAVCRDLCSLESRTVKKWALAALMALAGLAIGGRSASAEGSPQAIDCTGGHTPSMTLEIYNNSVHYNIYPVLFAGAPSGTDTWMQACFH